MASPNSNIDEQDIKFCQILTAMKEDILRIEDPKLIKQYTVWLEHLSQSKTINKDIRNRYLLELAHQIHEQNLKPPFTQPPARHPIKKIRKVIARKDSLEACWPYFRPLERKYSSKSRRKLNFEPKSTKRSDNSSWVDISDESVDNFACGDTDNDNQEEEKAKLSEQHVEQGKLLQQHYLNEYKAQLLEASNSDGKKSTISSKLENVLDQKVIKKEVDALKLWMNDLLEVKNALVDTHTLTEDRRKTIDNLQSMLKESELKNLQLKTLLAKQTKALSDFGVQKDREIVDLRETFRKHWQKEMAYMEQCHMQEKQNMEIDYQTKVLEIQSQFQKQLDDLKSNYEGKISELVCRNSLILREKDDEIFKLQKDVKSKEVISSESGTEQIGHLKKCISKLDKMLTKNEKDYLKKIEKLKQELEVKEMSTQIQLQTQKADLIMRFATSKQNEMEEALNNLEDKYKKLFQDLQQKSWDRRKQNEEVIGELRKLLEENMCFSEFCIPCSNSILAE